jgi:hypothetical protein
MRPEISERFSRLLDETPEEHKADVWHLLAAEHAHANPDSHFHRAVQVILGNPKREFFRADGDLHAIAPNRRMTYEDEQMHYDARIGRHRIFAPSDIGDVLKQLQQHVIDADATYTGSGFIIPKRHFAPLFHRHDAFPEEWYENFRADDEPSKAPAILKRHLANPRSRVGVFFGAALNDTGGRPAAWKLDRVSTMPNGDDRHAFYFSTPELTMGVNTFAPKGALDE